MKYRPRRRVTSFHAVLDTSWGKRNADIVDVTEQGARLRLEVGNLEPTSDITINIQGKGYVATVIWNREGYCGVKFHDMLNIQTLAAINRSLHRATNQKKQRFLIQ